MWNNRLVALTMLTVTGCTSLVHPQLGPMSYSDVGAGPQTRQALLAIGKLDGDLEQSSREHEIFGFVTGTALLVAGIAGLGLAVFDASRSAILAAGLAGGSLVGVRTFFPYEARRTVYNNGRLTLACSVTASRFGHLAGRGSTSGDDEDGVEPVVGPASRGEGSLAARLRDLSAELEAVAAHSRISADSTGLAGTSAVALDRRASTLEVLASSVRNVSEGVAPSDDEVAAQLWMARDAVEAALILPLGSLGVDADAALAKVRSVFASELTDIRDRAIAARELARQIDEGQRRVATDPEIAPDTPSRATDFQLVAEVKDAMGEIVRLTRLPTACFSGFEAAD